MSSPFPEPDADTIKAMNKAWSRTDLARYLIRWDRSPNAEIPTGFSDYSWRACDVGCGFGKYLIRESTRHPDRGYLGIDKGVLRGRNMLKRFQATGNANLYGIHANVIPVLAGFPDDFLDQITILYPNPWWPAKHRKKRWSYHPLLPKLIRLLKPGGTILLASNEKFYLGEWIYALRNHPALAKLDLSYAGSIHESEGRSHFETKFIETDVPCGEVSFTRC